MNEHTVGLMAAEVKGRSHGTSEQCLAAVREEAGGEILTAERIVETIDRATVRVVNQRNEEAHALDAQEDGEGDPG